jgi:DNA-binding beta-propeller fold protein YncE
MKYRLHLCCLFLFSFYLPCFAQEKSPAKMVDIPKTARTTFPGLQPNSQILLPNGWSLSPIGKQVPLGDFPVNVALTADGKFAAVLHCGYGSHEVRIVSLEKQTVVSTAQVDQSFYGMTFCQGDRVLAISGGEDENVYTFPFEDGFLAKPKTTTLASKKEKFVVSGVSAVDSTKELIVCGLLGNEVRAISQETGETRFKLGLGEGSYPYAACINDKDKLAYISLWGASSIAVVDIASGKLLHSLPTLSHPTEIKLLDEGRHLLVSCSNQNSVVLIDTQSMQQREVIRTSLFPKGSNGSTPSSLAVSADEKVLFAANADNNNLAVFDISDRGHSKSLGFIPVGWYPTSVRIAKDGSILVANGKGLTSRANVHGANPNNQPPATVREYIGGLFLGTLSIIDPPSPAEMSKYTRTAFECSPLNENETPNAKNVLADNPIPTEVGKPSPIKHCVYIVKENRTYDQVFGDMPKGNGDPTLCIFPERVTPNHHALASEYVLLDNFYVESEVSADGHEWTMAAYATDFVEKTWPLTYRGGRGKLGYPSEGKLKITEPTSGYIWDKCRARGISYFSFGEFVDNGPTIDSPATTKVESLKGHFDPKFRSYDLDYSDIKRAERFIERWNQFEQEGNLPQFMVIRLPNDHTYGTKVGKPTPTAMVADNDIALGMVVEALSKSKKWKETAIFVVEDDAQNGADHVDAHRTVALAISPYTRGAGLDSTLYSTSSMLRTMELILGLEPMTQFDASANPMYRSFKSTSDLTPYQKRDVMVDLSAKNDIAAWGAKQSAEMDLSKEDAADDLLFGDIVWRSVKGANNPMPAPVRSAFVFAEVEEE